MLLIAFAVCQKNAWAHAARLSFFFLFQDRIQKDQECLPFTDLLIVCGQARSCIFPFTVAKMALLTILNQDFNIFLCLYSSSAMPALYWTVALLLWPCLFITILLVVLYVRVQRTSFSSFGLLSKHLHKWEGMINYLLGWLCLNFTALYMWL